MVVVVGVVVVVVLVVVFGFVDVVAANTTAGAAPMNSANAAIEVPFIPALNTTARPEVARFRASKRQRARAGCRPRRALELRDIDAFGPFGPSSSS